MYILGTAGHVDHGKSSLIAALTGTHPDRLKEEKTREMTIELGFASMILPIGEEIGIIDVPGHRDFIANMLAGIGGIDAVLLVVAADEGVSAQTREHLAIVDLLDIRRGVIVLTKSDLVQDPEWLELVSMDIRELVQSTSLKDAPIVAVSSRNGSGILELLEQIQKTLQGIPSRKDLGKPRLPVDRVFTLTGFGTVVTGTLLDGSFKIGDEVVCLPGGKTGRIRGLQNHHHKLQKIEPGFRAAVNIVNLNYQDIARGDVIAHPGDYKPTTLLDAHFRLLNDSPYPLKHNLEVKLFLAASETTTRVRLLGSQVLKPGEDAFVQLRTDHPVVASKGDRFILRLPSPSETLGGGVILDPDPTQTYKRFHEDNLERLDKMFSGNESELVSQLLENLKATNLATLAQKSALPLTEISQMITSMLENKQVYSLGKYKEINKQTLIHPAYWQSLNQKGLESLATFHLNYPYKAGMPREEFRSELGLSQVLFDQVVDKMVENHLVVQKGSLVWASGHHVVLSPEDEALVAPLLADFQANPFSPPDINQLEARISADLIEGLLSSQKLVAVSDQVVFTPEALTQMRQWVQETILTSGELSLAQFRDHFKTSRKYAAAVLEYFDSTGFTFRKGDVRGLR
ncbi:MAG TPA: selenocysteine-specific translation elongation factor [Anaerolineaceae bacterium]|nr:selenocysteine-specific translation elongation factor [Anaerolineaceae bacterium]